MSNAFRSYNVCNVELDEYMQLETVCKELRKEKDILKELLLKEESKNAELIQRLQSNAMSDAWSLHKRYIDELERELKNSCLEIGYLQDQLNLRNVESNCIGEHVHGLELKLAEVGTMHEKLRLLSEALMQSDARCLSLMQELKYKEEELHNSALQIEELESSISSITLESQCEIESMRLDIAAFEERCSEAERLSQQAAQEKAKMDLLLEMSESQLQDAQERVNCLEIENKDLKWSLLVSEANADGSCCKVMEHLDTWLKHSRRMTAGSFRDLLVELKNKFPLLKEICTCEEVYCPFVSNPTAAAALDGNVEETAKMSNQIRELELQVVQLKEELRTEKLKAKDEAEDLTQAMAELRYQMTDMIEEESKRRASVEQTSLRRIQDLEEQVRTEINKHLATTRHFQEAHMLAEMRAVEVRHLKNALEGFRKITDPETVQKIESCNCGDCPSADILYECSRDIIDAEALDDDSSNGYSAHQALIGWYPEDKDPSIEAEN